MPKLTDTFCRNACKAPNVAQSKFWDSEIKGFGLFVGSTAKAFYYQRDVGGKTARTRIGPFPTITAAAARETALGLALQHARGAGKAAMRKAPTLQEAIDAYLERPKLRSAANKANVRGQLELHLADWLKKPLDEIDEDMVVTRHRKLLTGKNGATHPARANSVMESFRTVHQYARSKNRSLPESPTVAIEWYPEPPSGAVIDDLGRWQLEVDALKNPIHRTYYRLLLTTGLRRSECMGLRWPDIRDDHLHLDMTKNGRPFDLPLTEDHHRILAAVRGLDPVWVFPAWRNGASPHIVSPAPLSWSLHAHRRTFATIAVSEAGLLEETVGRLLNHTPVSVTGSRYVVLDHQKLRSAMVEVMTAFKRLLPAFEK